MNDDAMDLINKIQTGNLRRYLRDIAAFTSGDDPLVFARMISNRRFSMVSATDEIYSLGSLSLWVSHCRSILDRFEVPATLRDEAEILLAAVAAATPAE